MPSAPASTASFSVLGGHDALHEQRERRVLADPHEVVPRDLRIEHGLVVRQAHRHVEVVPRVAVAEPDHREVDREAHGLEPRDGGGEHLPNARGR